MGMHGLLAAVFSAAPGGGNRRQPESRQIGHLKPAAHVRTLALSRFAKKRILIIEGILMEVLVRHLDKVTFEASARGHRITCDQPLDNGGSDAGMTPPELLLASLGTCAGFYAAQYLAARSLPAEGLEIRVTAEKALQPARLGAFRIDVSVPALDPKHEAGVLRAVNACLIHNTLVNAPRVETAVRTAQLAERS